MPYLELDIFAYVKPLELFYFRIPMTVSNMTSSQQYTPIPSIVVQKKKQSRDEADSRVSELNDVDFFFSKDNDG